MNTAKEGWIVATYIYRQMFLRRYYALAILVGLAIMCSASDFTVLFGILMMLGGLPTAAIGYLPPHLPVRRHTVLIVAVVPSLLVLLASFVTALATEDRGLFDVGSFSTPFQVSATGSSSFARKIDVPGQYWELGGAEPRWLQLDGGDRVQAERRHLMGPVYAHNPYTVPEGASARTAATQLKKVLDRCCSLSLSVGQVEAHLRHPDAGSLPLAAAARLQGSTAHILARHVVLLMFMLAWTRLTLGGQAHRERSRLNRSQRWRRATPGVLFLVAFLSALVAYQLGYEGLLDSSVAFGLQVVHGQVLRLASNLPLLSGAVALGGIGLATHWLYRHFLRLELPLHKRAFDAC